MPVFFIKHSVALCMYLLSQGFGVTDVSPKLTKAFLHMSATYYPERLAMFMLIDTPKVFSKLWDAVEKLVVGA